MLIPAYRGKNELHYQFPAAPSACDCRAKARLSVFREADEASKFLVENPNHSSEGFPAPCPTDPDEIQAYNPPFYRETCQRLFAMGKQTRFVDGTSLPCELCWSEISPGVQLKLTADFKRQAANRQAINAAAGWFDGLRRVLDVIDAKQQVTENLQAEAGASDR